MNDDQKDSPEVREFRRLLAQIRQFCDDDMEELRGLVGDESVALPAIDLLRVAGILQQRQRSRPNLSASPVDPAFIEEWQSFERDYATILVEIAQQSKSGNFLIGDFYVPRPVVSDDSWFAADLEAIALSEAFRAALLRVETAAAEQAAEAFGGNMNPSYSKGTQAEYLCYAKARGEQWDEGERVRKEWYDDIFGSLEGREAEHLPELVRRAALTDPPPISDEDMQGMFQSVFFEWVRKSHESGLDLRGILRRRALVPFVHFPRHVSRRLQGGDEPSVYNNLRQAHDAFIFGAPFAALALMRSVMERVLRSNYGASGADLDALIRSAARRLPPAASAAALDRLRRRANAVLHDRETSNDAPAWSRSSVREAELDMLSLLGVLRNLIEGAPERPA